MQRSFDLKLSAVSFLAGVLFMLPAFLFVCHQRDEQELEKTQLNLRLQQVQRPVVPPPPIANSFSEGTYWFKVTDQNSEVGALTMMYDSASPDIYTIATTPPLPPGLLLQVVKPKTPAKSMAPIVVLPGQPQKQEETAPHRGK